MLHVPAVEHFTICAIDVVVTFHKCVNFYYFTQKLLIHLLCIFLYHIQIKMKLLSWPFFKYLYVNEREGNVIHQGNCNLSYVMCQVIQFSHLQSAHFRSMRVMTLPLSHGCQLFSFINLCHLCCQHIPDSICCFTLYNNKPIKFHFKIVDRVHSK